MCVWCVYYVFYVYMGQVPEIKLMKLIITKAAGRGDNCPGRSRRSGAKQPEHKCYMTNKHKLLPSVLWRCWLGGRKGIWPVKTEWWVAGVLSVWSEVQTCIWPSWCHCHSLSLASVKSRLVLPFWYRLTWVVPDKAPLNGCVCNKHKSWPNEPKTFAICVCRVAKCNVCHMGSHSVSCHPDPSRSWYSIKRPQRDARLSWPSWLVTYRDGIPAQRRSPIQVLTGPDVR